MHLLESVRALSRCERIYVLGSSSLLPSFAALGEPGGPLELTYDADLLIEPTNERLAAMLHEAIGEGSLFARETGYHADFLRPEIVERLSPGWHDRLVPIAGGKDGALAPVDLVVVKLRAGRPKDLVLCRNLVVRGLVDKQGVRGLLDKTPLEEAEIAKVYRRLDDLGA